MNDDIVKCKFCKNDIKKNIAYKVGKTSYYCDELCYQRKKEQQNKQKNKYKPKDNTDRLECIDYIQQIYINEGYDKSEINWKLITAILKKLLEDNMCYSGIIYTLWYCKEIINIDLFDDKSNTILWCVPFEYKNAQLYWEECQSVIESVDNFDFNEEIKIIKNTENKKTKRRMINMEDL